MGGAGEEEEEEEEEGRAVATVFQHTRSIQTRAAGGRSFLY